MNPVPPAQPARGRHSRVFSLLQVHPFLLVGHGFDGGPSPAAAEALDRMEAWVVDRTRLLEASRAQPDLAVTSAGLFARRLRAARARIDQVAPPEVGPRLGAALLSLL
jgi:CRP-like cAMP-binding protein